jgi:CRP/FNR family cyclic AMP-dependent transcriptional regulator
MQFQLLKLIVKDQINAKMILMSLDMDLLRKTDLFKGLSKEELGKITGISAKENFPVNQPIFAEGEKGDKFYLILNGEVRISKLIAGVGEEALKVLTKGDYFGEMSLIDDEPRSAHAIANSAGVDLMVIDRHDFSKLLSEDKELAYKLLWSMVRTLSQRLRETNEKIKGFFAMTGPFK